MRTENQARKRETILNLVNHFGSISRTELTEITDYRPGTVSDIIRELLEEKLLTEGCRVSSGSGRKRVLLELNREYICAIGISITADMITAVVCRIDGMIIERFEDPIEGEMSHEDIKQIIVCRTEQLLKLHADKRIVGIGIGDPLYDPLRYRMNATFTANFSHFNDWVHLEVCPALEAVSGLPVRSLSAVTLPALVEKRFGAAKGKKDFICVELSNGIGASICCNGNVVGGANGVAGEIGHMVCDMSRMADRLCYCGKPGCIETETAFPALIHDIRDALDKGRFSFLRTDKIDMNAPITVSDIRAALEKNDQLCSFYVSRITAKIGVAVANAINLLNPEMVVLYGFMLELGDTFINALVDEIRKNVLVLARDVEIKISWNLEKMIPMGAAVEMFTSFLKMGEYAWIYRLEERNV